MWEIFAFFNVPVQAVGETNVSKFQDNSSTQSQMGTLMDCEVDDFRMPFSKDCQMSFSSWPAPDTSSCIVTTGWRGSSGFYNAYYSCYNNNNLYYKVCLESLDIGSYGDCNTQHDYGDTSWKGLIQMSNGDTDYEVVRLCVTDENDSDSGGITCTLQLSCPDKFTGGLCETPICDRPCLHQGLCVGHIGEQPTCQCADGWTGSDCSLSQCDYDFCQHGGTCSGPNECSCPTGWSGDDCTINTCKQPCAHGGNCTGPDVCTCPSGWSGTYCSNYLCSETGCVHGICMGLNKCECDVSWTIWGNDPACSGYLGMPQYAVVFGGLLVFFLFSYSIRLCWVAMRKRKVNDDQDSKIYSAMNDGGEVVGI